jgi:NTP pyrophosphatase (non-canonical NTP hydrolase)
VGYPKFGTTIAEMTAEVREINIEKGWRPADGGPGTNTFGDYIALLHSELSEALEAYRDWRLRDETGPKHPFDNDGSGCCTWCEAPDHNGPYKPEGVGSELADVLIRLVDTCDVFGIDLKAEYRRKVAYNRTRPFQHGGRTLADTGISA